MDVNDLPMGGCIPAAAHYEHMAAGNPLCQNQPGHDLYGIGRFGTVVVDPPWAFTFSTRKSESGNNGWRGSTDHHYANLSIKALRDLPIPDVSADDSVLWLWSVNHSAKPDAAYEVIETLTPGPYLDVFARRQREGWTCWGDETAPLKEAI